MFKKLFLGFLMVASPLYAAETGRSAVSANPNARPANAARAPTLPGISGVISGTLSGSAISSASVSDSRCANPLPDQLSTSRCIQRYMACLNQDTVCGSHFESCDTQTRFNQKKIFCQDKLLACPDDGIASIFGATVRSATVTATCDGEQTVVQRTFTAPSGGLQSLTYAPTSMIASAITDGSAWVSNNAAQSCISTVDGCIARACQNNAYKCVSVDVIDPTDANGNGIPDVLETVASNVFTNIYAGAGGAVVSATTVPVDPAMVQQYINNKAYASNQVSDYLKNACETEIGTSKACYTVVNGDVPKNDSWLSDTFEVENVYSNMVQVRLASNRNKILEWIAGNVGDAVVSCKTSANDCIKSACGSGSIAACYGSALTGVAPAQVIDIANATLQPVLAARCTGSVDANQNCRDLLIAKMAPATPAAIWDRVFGTAADTYQGAFGLVGELNNQLSGMFNDVTIRNLYTQCRGEAESCIKRECGTNFENCYINDKMLSSDSALAANANYGQSDISYGVSSATANAAGGFDELMAQSVCLLPIKRSDSCQNYFDIQFAKKATAAAPYSWAGSMAGMNTALSNSWNTTTTTTVAAGTTTTNTLVCSALKNYSSTTVTNAAGSTSTVTDDPTIAVCGAIERDVFNDLIADIAQTARAQLAKAQNTLKNSCETHRGGSSLGDTYLWAAKPDATAMADITEKYAASGLGAAQAPTSDLWGAFCQVKVGLQSADANLNKLFQAGFGGTAALKDKDGNDIQYQVKSHISAYFSLGDSVMCGSWLSQADLDAIEANIRGEAAQSVEENRGWLSSNAGIVGAVVGAVGGGVAGNLIGKQIENKQHANDITDADLKAAQDGLDDFEKEIDNVSSDVDSANKSGSAAATPASGLSADYVELQRVVNSAINSASGVANNNPAANGQYVRDAATGALTSTNTNISGDLDAAKGIVSGVAGDDKSAVAGAIGNQLRDFLTSKQPAASAPSATPDTSAVAKMFKKSAMPSKTHNGLKGVVDGQLKLYKYEAVAKGPMTYEQVTKELDKLRADVKKIRESKADKGAGLLSAQNVGTIIGAGALGTGGYFLAKSIGDKQNELNKVRAGDAGVAAWFDKVGSKIQCTVGGKVIGSYGDVVELK